ncbi:MAG TPA: hypothetical protein VF476_19620 [Chitinophagaceae bacterium]
MLKDLHFLRRIDGEKLDRYLLMGWYRIGQLIFTTDHIPYAEGWKRVFWLRFPLDKISFHKKHEKLFAGNDRFSIGIRPFQLTEELEELYQLYYNHLDFTPSPTLHNALFDHSVFEDQSFPVFDSFVIEVRDKEQLIAAGVFDMGKNSLAGIINFFHPVYRKFALGKWLMLLKIQYAKQQGMQFYYPGYIAADYNKFDYKLFPGKAAAEIYDPLQQEWLSYSANLIQALKNTIPAPGDDFIIS